MEAPPDRPRGGLKIQSIVPNAEVFLDGSSLGRAPVERRDLDPGKHYIGPPRRLHRLQARDHAGREPGGDAGGRPVGHRLAAHPLDARRGRGADRRGAHRPDAGGSRRLRRRSRGRVPPQGLLRSQGDDEGRRRPREGLLGRPQADPDRAVARAGGAAADADVVVRRASQPGRRRHRRLRPRLSLVPLDARDGGGAELQESRPRRRRPGPDDVRHHRLRAARPAAVPRRRPVLDGDRGEPGRWYRRQRPQLSSSTGT